jgi:predicted HicB family RNase H-like nuclease
MDEITHDLAKIRGAWGSTNANAAKAKTNRRRIEKAARRSSEFYTGRSEQLNVRLTEELKAAVQTAAKNAGLSMAEFFEMVMTAHLQSGGGK